MNEDFNKRATELFGEEVGGLLRDGNIFAGRIMDDNRDLPYASKLIKMSDEDIVATVKATAEKQFLYGIYCAKFVNHPSNQDPTGYDSYKYGDTYK